MKTSLVVGATSSIGTTYIRDYYYRSESRVIAVSNTRSLTESHEWAKEMHKEGRLVEKSTDLSDGSAVEYLIEELIESQISEALLIAGGRPTTIPGMPGFSQDCVSLALTHSISHSCIIDRIFKKTRCARAVYISSTAISWKGENYHYSAAKVHAEQSMLALAKKHREKNNRINIVRLTLMEKEFANTAVRYTADDFNNRQQLIPGGKAIKFEDVNIVLQFLLSDESKLLNGNILSLDKGESIVSASI